MLEPLTRQLAAAQPLAGDQVRQAVEALADDRIPPAVKADFLAALARKGETPDEIAAFARALRDKSILVPLDACTRAGELLDVVGTGGDGLRTFNISTTTALLCAAAGVTVAKHGNRAVTSQAGSADVLEALGVRIDLTPAEAARSLREHHFAFFFAPAYHPVFRHIAPARRLCAERGQPTIFNILGPLLNPARPSALLVGVPRPELCEPLARVLQSVGVRRAMIVCGSIRSSESGVGSPEATVPGVPIAGHFFDELSPLGPNTVADFYEERGFAASVLSPEQFPLQRATPADLLGGDRRTNAEIARRILRGAERGPKRDAVLLNAAAALFVAGRAKSLNEGWDLAAKTIDSGHAAAKLADITR